MRLNLPVTDSLRQFSTSRVPQYPFPSSSSLALILRHLQAKLVEPAIKKRVSILETPKSALQIHHFGIVHNGPTMGQQKSRLLRARGEQVWIHLAERIQAGGEPYPLHEVPGENAGPPQPSLPDAGTDPVWSESRDKVAQ